MMASHTGHSRRLKEAEEGHLDVRGVADARQELHGEERVASQLKEIVVDADLFEAQEVAPDGCNLLLNGGTRRDVEVFEGRPDRARARGAPGGPPCRWVSAARSQASRKSRAPWQWEAAFRESGAVP